MKLVKTTMARVFLIALLGFVVWQIPVSIWASLWQWALDTGRLFVLAK